MERIGEIGSDQQNSILKQLLPLNFNTKGVRQKRADQRSIPAILRELLFAPFDECAKDRRRDGNGRDPNGKGTIPPSFTWEIQQETQNYYY